MIANPIGFKKSATLNDKASVARNGFQLFEGIDAEPREHQMNSVATAIRMFLGTQFSEAQPHNPAGSVYLESPVGSGKMLMGLMIAKYLQENFGLTVGWVTNSPERMSRVKWENVLRQTNVDLNLMTSNQTEFAEVDLLIVDNLESSDPKTVANLHDQTNPQLVLGLGSIETTESIQRMFDFNLSAGSLNEMINEGHLSPYNHFVCPELTALSAVETYLNSKSKWGRTLMLFDDVAEAELCKQLLNAAGVNVGMAQSENLGQYAAFGVGKIDVLICTESVPAEIKFPSLKTLFLASNLKASTLVTLQQLLQKSEQVARKCVVQPRTSSSQASDFAKPQAQWIWDGKNWVKIEPATSTPKPNLLGNVNWQGVSQTSLF